MPKFNFEQFNVEKPLEFDSYIERLDCHFVANDTDNNKKSSIFLSVMGADCYSIVRNLTSPSLPSTKTYENLVGCLRSYFKPKVNIVATRFRFHKRIQLPSETVNSYMNCLRQIAATCDFGDFRDQALRDQLICGLWNETAQSKCLSDPEITLDKAYNLASALEGAQEGVTILRNSQMQSSTPGTSIAEDTNHMVSKVTSKEGRTNTKPPSKCNRCLSTHHVSKNCNFKDTVCNFCHKLGHIEKACYSKNKSIDSLKIKSKFNKQNRNTSITKLDIASSNTASNCFVDSASDDSIMKIEINAVTDPYYVDLILQEKYKVNFLIDTGAAVSLINKQTWKKCGRFKLINAQKLTTYTGEEIPTIGKAEVKISSNKEFQSTTSSIIVVDTNGSNLIGRDLLGKIKLDWNQVFKISSVSSVSESHSVERICESFPNVFKDDLGLLQEYKATLQMKDGAKPKFYKPRTIPYGIKEKVKTEINRLTHIGILRPVNFSNYSTPIVPVLKNDGSIRICGDYKVTINPLLQVDQHPMPNTRDILATLNGCKYFTKLDLSQAFNQILLDEESMKLTTINTPWGMFEYTRLAFGIANSPAIFQRCIDNVLQGLPNVVSRVDDILIATKSKSEHLTLLKEVLERLNKYNLRVRKDKCRFLQSSVLYLGYIISLDGIRPDPSKIEAIKNAPQPTNVSEVRSFCGFINYYSNFIPNVSDIMSPLFELTKQNHRFKWTQECNQSFEKLKSLITSDSILSHFDSKNPILLACDASPYGLGVVLSQLNEQGIEKPVCFASRTLTSAEKNYSQLERESLSIIFGITKFHDYLLGLHFTIETDHQPLVKIFNEMKGIPTIAASRLQRWSLKLSAHSYTIRYKKGKNNNADMLSRLPMNEENKNDDKVSTTDIIQAVRINSLPVSADEVSRATMLDPKLSKILVYQRTEWPDVCPAGFDNYYKKRHEITIEGNVLLHGIRVIVPEKLKSRVIEQLHETHPGINRMKGIARSHVWWPGIDADIDYLVRNCDKCQQQQPNDCESTVHPLVWPSSPWYRLHLDYAGPFYGKMWLVVVDATSKWPEIYPVNEATSSNTIKILSDIFARFGLPRQVFTDNGTSFSSNEFNMFCKSNGIKAIKSTPFHPRSNGAAERMVRTFKTFIKKENPSSYNVNNAVSDMLFRYRNTPHATTGRCPYELLFTIKPATKLDRIHPNIQDRVLNKQLKQRDASFRARGDSLFKLGENVYVKDYRSKIPNKWSRATVVAVRGPLSYEVEVDNLIWRRHADQMRSTHPDHCPTDQPIQLDQTPNSRTIDQPIQFDQTINSRTIDQPFQFDQTMNSRPLNKTATEATLERPVPDSPETTEQTEHAKSESKRYPTRERKPVERLNYS